MEHIKQLFLILMALISLSAFGQELKESEVPKEVRECFRAKYPDVYVYEWEWKRKKMIYEAEFIMKGSKYEATFTKEGEWIKTERDIKKADLPQKVWDGLSQTEYAAWKVDDIEEHSTPKYELVYEIEVKSKKRKVLLYFLPNGKLVETEVKR